LNDNSIFELVLKDELILGVAGILEYDPDFPSMKACYKTHLSTTNSSTTFIELIPIKNQSLLNKIHQTHRLHYLKDVILARILEDSTHSMLNSAIYFNEVEIVNEVVGNGNGNGNNGDPGIVEQVFKILTGEEEEEDFKGKGKEKEKESRDNDQLRPRLLKQPEDDDDEISLRKSRSIQFLTQLTQMAKNLQLPLRTSFYRQLVEKGLLKALESALRFANDQRDLSLRAMVIAMWMSVVDLDAKDVRAYCLKQGKEKEKQQEEEEQQQEDDDNSRKKEKLLLLEETMLGGLIETLKNEQDLGIKTHLAEALRVLLDAAGDSGPLEAPPRLRLPEDPEAEKFLQYFYDHYILSLLEPLLSLTSTSTSTTTVVTPSLTALLSHLCDLLCFFVAHHSFRSKYLILSSPQLAKSVSILLHPPPPPPQVNSDNTSSSSRLFSRQTHLRLASLRFFRSCIAKNDDFYNRFLIKHDLLKSVVETVLEEKDKDNLLGSACLEFFEYIRAVSFFSLSLFLFSLSLPLFLGFSLLEIQH
jgi:protein phosphatase-4 regulatory subunit 3